MIFKQYRINRISRKLEKNRAEYIELVRVIATIKGNDSYYMDKGIELKGVIAFLECQLSQMVLQVKRNERKQHEYS